MTFRKLLILILLLACSRSQGQDHEITFCGEKIPVHNEIVAKKLMNVIKSQTRQVNMIELRKRAEKLLPIVEYVLEKSGLPTDFKYLPIVESGFLNATSRAGAQGIWQLMPATATELGLQVSNTTDERNNFFKSTMAACKVLASYYLLLKKNYKVSSWVLTAAAYNFGIGNITNAITKQGKDYFMMNLNPETAAYVYKIIAVKELFEYPELYVKDFDYNIFNPQAKKTSKASSADTTTAYFKSISLDITNRKDLHPEQVSVDSTLTIAEVDKHTASTIRQPPGKFRLVSASISGKYKAFNDGELVEIEIHDHLQVGNWYASKGNKIAGRGWIIDDRVFVDLGFNNHDVILYDKDGKQGIPLSNLKNKVPLSIKVRAN
jgi:membrane-bound lytic murein transglycosylase D